MADEAQFKRITMPLVRRIYPQLIADKIVNVQPLLGPTGLLHYLRYKYSGEQPTREQPIREQPTRRKNIRRKRYRSIDDPWENQE
jgi:hypothetical protein